MATGLAELVILGLIADYVFRKMRFPGLVGMMLTGIALGPWVLGLADPGLLAISGEWRRIALVVILLRAGFELHRNELRRVGKQALLLSAVPALFEGAAITLLGPPLLDLSYMESAIMGMVLAAVSPAVVVPMMLDFAAKKRGTDKGIPTLVVAASSIDDIFVIVVFTVLLGLYSGAEVNVAWKLAGIPISIALGIGAGLACGWGLYRAFAKFNPRATKRLLAIMGTSIVLVAVEGRIGEQVPFAALLAVMSLGAIILAKNEFMAKEISAKLSKLWVFAEIVLFTLVGTQVDLGVAWGAGLAACILIALGLVARSAGTYLCLLGSELNVKERLFVVIAYLPKATVQAAIGGTPLLAMSAGGMDVRPGEVILAVAAMSILLTAPLGAWAIALAGKHLLTEEKQPGSNGTKDSAEAGMRVGDAMDGDCPAIGEGGSIRSLIEIFAATPYSVCPVLDVRGRLIGMVRFETLRPLLASEHVWRSLLASDVAENAPPPITPDQPLRQAMDAMHALGLREMPVVGDEGGMAGLLCRETAEHRLHQARLFGAVGGEP